MKFHFRLYSFELQYTGKYDVIAKHRGYEFDFADGQTFAGFRAGVGFFLKSPMLYEEIKKTFGKSIGQNIII